MAKDEKREWFEPVGFYGARVRFTPNDFASIVAPPLEVAERTQEAAAQAATGVATDAFYAALDDVFRHSLVELRMHDAEASYGHPFSWSREAEPAERIAAIKAIPIVSLVRIVQGIALLIPRM